MLWGRFSDFNPLDSCLIKGKKAVQSTPKHMCTKAQKLFHTQSFLLKDSVRPKMSGHI